MVVFKEKVHNEAFLTPDVFGIVYCIYRKDHLEQIYFLNDGLVMMGEKHFP